ncbi:MAG: AAA family ATPase, partial [Luteitalea sp.]|nr:AAA family ATPase [Luteitalea sp.]
MGDTPQTDTSTQSDASDEDILRQFGETAAAGPKVSEDGDSTPPDGKSRYERLLKRETERTRAQAEARRIVAQEELERSLESRPRITLVNGNETKKRPYPRAVVEGMVWERFVTLLAAESGTGKSFLMLSAAGAVAYGVPWCGRSVEQGAVVYLSYEGDALGLRLQALEKDTGRPVDQIYLEHFRSPLSPAVSRDGGEIASIGEWQAQDAIITLRDELETRGLPPIRLIVVDTVRMSLAGSEDSSENVSSYVRAIRRLLEHIPKAGAVLVHHAGWQDGESKRKRERGSSAWRGNVD